MIAFLKKNRSMKLVTAVGMLILTLEMWLPLLLEVKAYLGRQSQAKPAMVSQEEAQNHFKAALETGRQEHLQKLKQYQEALSRAEAKGDKMEAYLSRTLVHMEERHLQDTKEFWEAFNPALQEKMPGKEKSD